MAYENERSFLCNNNLNVIGGSAFRPAYIYILAIFNMADDMRTKRDRDRDREIQRSMEREESRSNWIHKGCTGQIY